MNVPRALTTLDYPKNKMIEKFVSTNQVSYIILNYDKNVFCFDDSSLCYYRSVIASYPERKLLSCSPPKSIPLTKEWIHPSEFRITKQVEGFMINLFYDERNDTWEIATKRGIGGYYAVTKKTFYDMFIEVVPQFRDTELPKDACYSFVLQTDTNTESVRLHLISIYRINRANSTISYIDPLEYPFWIGSDPILSNSVLYYPTILFSDESIELSSLVSLVKSEDDLSYTTGLSIMNLITGDRHFVNNPVHIRQQMIRKCNPLSVVMFLCFLRIGKVFCASKQFPYYKTLFNMFFDEYQYFIRRLLYYYSSYYVKKTVDMVPEKYFTHIYKIHHTIYLPNCKSGCKISYKIVHEFFMTMEPKQLYHFIFCSC